MGLVGPILQLLVILLPEIISLAKSFKNTPQEEREKRLAEVRSAMQEAAKKLGNTAPIEKIINNG